LEPLTLKNCESEPIHIPGAIQPHGVLIACRLDERLTIAHASENADIVFGCEARLLIDSPLSGWFDEHCQAALLTCSNDLATGTLGPVSLTSKHGVFVEACLHRSNELVIFEIEPARRSELTFDSRLRDAMARLQSPRDIADLTRVAAAEVRKITGFDRTMVYRFDPEWNGEVVAEARREDLEPFLGLHYPATDIPAQARRLYEQNWLRHIVDVSYRPVPLLPREDLQTGAPLDLSHAYLRSVSPIHIEYLKNMGVTASMSISLIADGRLLGLIACHHYSGPHQASRRVRETCEFLGQALSWHIQVLERAETVERQRRVQECEAAIAQALTTADDVLEGLAVPALVELAEAHGAAIVFHEGIQTLGTTPDEDAIRKLVEWLSKSDLDVLATSKLAEDYEPAGAWDTVGAGLLAVCISKELREYLLWFRPSTEKVVDWAGDPRKVTVARDEAPRLSPRGSFALWRETVRGRSIPWAPWQVDAASNVRRLMVAGVRRRSVALRNLNSRLVEDDRAKDVFLATVSHELRTPLNAICGWTGLLSEGRLDAEKSKQAVQIVARNAANLGRLVDDLLDVSRIVGGKLALDLETVDIGALVDASLDAMTFAGESKPITVHRRIARVPLIVRGDSSRITQIFNNLLSNAFKFTPKGGSITVSVSREESDVEISISDSGQGIDEADLQNVFGTFWQADSSTTRKNQGLGLGLAIAKKLTELHSGTLQVRSAGVGHGATFTVRLPIAPTLPIERGHDSVWPRLGTGRQLENAKVLVVEDGEDARLLLQQILEQQGAHVLVAYDAPSALRMLDENPDVDAIVSDIGLPETDGLHLMRTIRMDGRHRMPAVALSAYSRALNRAQTLRAGFQAHLAKPADPEELVATIASLLGRVTAAQ
jgi:two-component system, chemotaxis family, sensor kinase Cph1